MRSLPFEKGLKVRDENSSTLSLVSTGKTDCRSCLPGYYCPSGKSAPIPCPAGTYNSLSGRGSLSDCRSCSAGMACPQPALTAPPVKCDAGHFCPQGSVLPNATRNACPRGTYTDYHNLTHVRECSQCPVGHSCEAGTGGRQKQPQLCATGVYVADDGDVNDDDDDDDDDNDYDDGGYYNSNVNDDDGNDNDYDDPCGMPLYTPQ